MWCVLVSVVSFIALMFLTDSSSSVVASLTSGVHSLTFFPNLLVTKHNEFSFGIMEVKEAA